MIVFMSNSGESLPIAYRLKQEGTKSVVYLHGERYRHNYKNMVPTIGLGSLKETLKKATLVIFDISRNNEGSKNDHALLKMFGLKKTSSSVFGPVADKLKKSVKVIGQSEETETLELDRKEGADLAKKIGIQDPETYEFHGLKEGINFLQSEKDALFVFKPCNNQDMDMTYVEKFPGELIEKMQHDYPRRIGGEKLDFIIQKCVDGHEISTEFWWTGEEAIHFNHTIEDKRLMNASLGPTIGSQNNTVWMKKKMSGLLVKELKKMGEVLKKAKYIGPCDCNSIISKEDGKPRFLEWSIRFGYDALFCLLSQLKTPLTDFFTNDFQGEFHDGFTASARLTIPPFPYHEPKLLDAFAKEVPIGGRLDNFWMEDVLMDDRIRCAAADGILGVMVNRGDTPLEAWQNVYRDIQDIKVGAYLQYRTDGPRRAEKVIAAFQKKGIEYE